MPTTFPTYNFNYYADGTNVYFSCNYTPSFSDKRTVAASASVDSGYNLTYPIPSKWQVIAIVSE
jgi:hypothetical protein